jgi:hypothetical protein
MNVNIYFKNDLRCRNFLLLKKIVTKHPNDPLKHFLLFFFSLEEHWVWMRIIFVWMNALTIWGERMRNKKEVYAAHVFPHIFIYTLLTIFLQQCIFYGVRFLLLFYFNLNPPTAIACNTISRTKNKRGENEKQTILARSSALLAIKR